MAVATSNVPFALEEELAITVLDLQHSMLRGFLWATALAHVGWYYYVAPRDSAFYFYTVALLLVISILYAIARLYRTRYRLASSLLLLLIVLFEGLAFARYSFSTLFCLGVLGVIVAHALLSTRPALLVAFLTWLMGSILTWNTPAGMVPLWPNTGILAVYLLVWAASWLSNRPVRASVEWAISGWAQAREALAEVRNRRSELYRALRALQEATYRIERMNRELILARREAELARAQKARFAATVSHELRGPLSLILGFSRLLARSPQRYGEPLPAACIEDIETVYRNTQHLMALVDDVLDLAQIEAEKLPLVKDRVDLDKDVVQRAISIVQPLAERKGLYLRQELAGDLPWIIADPVRLRQALLNLLVNAVRFTVQGGIVVRTACQGNQLLVSVEDTGPGIATEDIPKLFREFSQLQQPGEAESTGSGLGLNISKELIELHGGRIWVESTVGIGTMVHFAVPLLGAYASDDAFIKTADHLRPEQDSECCLVVHDDPGIVRLLARYIESYRIVGLPDEEHLANLAANLHPRAVLTTPDMVSRVEQALTVTRLDIPIITCGMPHIKGQPNFPGVLSYLIKPVLPEAFTSVMGQVERNEETTVLLVDDDPDAVRLLESMLLAISHPYRILKAYSGREALARMATVIPDVVFLDLVMPEVSGEEVIARMRSDGRLVHVPIVIISARDWAGDRTSVEPPISIRTPQAIEILRAAKCLGTLLDMLNPSYLEEVALPGSL